MANLKISTFNVKGLRNVKKRRKIFQYIHQRNFDLICLQEAHSTETEEKIWKSEFRGKIIYSHGTSDSRGVMLLVKQKAPIIVGKISRDTEGRRIIAECKYKGLHFVLMNIYAPNNDDENFFINSFQELDKMVNEVKAEERVVLGNLNLVLDIEKDKVGGRKVTHEKAANTVKAYMEIENLEDIWRVKNPESRIMTWTKHNPELILERLDYILMSAQMTQDCATEGIAAAFMSDHAIPWVIISPCKEAKGKGF